LVSGSLSSSRDLGPEYSVPAPPDLMRMGSFGEAKPMNMGAGAGSLSPTSKTSRPGWNRLSPGGTPWRGGGPRFLRKLPAPAHFLQFFRLLMNLGGHPTHNEDSRLDPHQTGGRAAEAGAAPVGPHERHNSARIRRFLGLKHCGSSLFRLCFWQLCKAPPATVEADLVGRNGRRDVEAL